jgi:hypothetical protein
MKHPPIYYDPDNMLEISFIKLPGYKKIGKSYRGGFEAFKFKNKDQMTGFVKTINLVRDTYCLTWDEACCAAYNDRDFDSQVWTDLSCDA